MLLPLADIAATLFSRPVWRHVTGLLGGGTLEVTWWRTGGGLGEDYRYCSRTWLPAKSRIA